MASDTASVLDEVAQERLRQDEKWGGPKHDDMHLLSDWARWIQDRAQLVRDTENGHAALTDDAVRRQLLEISALGAAAVESWDRARKRITFLLASAAPPEHEHVWTCPCGWVAPPGADIPTLLAHKPDCPSWNRHYIEHPAERAIQLAVDRVEEMGASEELTAIVVSLGALREAVAHIAAGAGHEPGAGRTSSGVGTWGLSGNLKVLPKSDDDTRTGREAGTGRGEGQAADTPSSGRTDSGSGVVPPPPSLVSPSDDVPSDAYEPLKPPKPGTLTTAVDILQRCIEAHRSPVEMVKLLRAEGWEPPSLGSAGADE